MVRYIEFSVNKGPALDKMPPVNKTAHTTIHIEPSVWAYIYSLRSTWLRCIRLEVTAPGGVLEAFYCLFLYLTYSLFRQIVLLTYVFE